MNTIDYIVGQVRSMGVSDIIDIVVIAYLIFRAVKLLRETRAMQLVSGIALIVVIYLASYFGKLRTLNFLIRALVQIGAMALIVLFQPELRRALAQVGRSGFKGLNLFSYGTDTESGKAGWQKCIDAVCEAAISLSKQKIGALIVFERQTPLGEVIETGTPLDAEASSELFGNLFFPNSPLHDGAVVIRLGRITAAGCYLPLSDNFTISKELGTRHRAALGVSEVSDAVVVVVSEETGKITMTDNGIIKRGLTVGELKKELQNLFTENKEPGGALIGGLFKPKGDRDDRD